MMCVCDDEIDLVLHSFTQAYHHGHMVSFCQKVLDSKRDALKVIGTENELECGFQGVPYPYIISLIDCSIFNPMFYQ